MYLTPHRDLEGEDDPGGQRDDPQPSQGESLFGDSSGPLFSIYSKVAEEEDNKMVERWQKDADGILIFTGLFSAAVAALLAVTVQDLRPNSQDTSAFYLGNIYEVLADPNITRASSPTPVAKPPPFSRPRHAVWVNSLWFLSLVMSVSCALWATSLHQWARRYVRLTQPARCSPEKRARMRAFFANGVDKMHVSWAVEGLPALLHLSLFLFFGGLAIFLFNVDQEVFTFVVSWIGLFSIVYGLVTLLPSFRNDSPYNTPLSIIAWFLHARMRYLAFKALVYFRKRFRKYPNYAYRIRTDQMEMRLNRWKSLGVEKKAEELAEEQSSEIDVRILSWTIGALGDDDSLEKFFEAIPGFFNSELVDLESNFPVSLLKTLWDAMYGFMGRTTSSNSVTERVKYRRDIICTDILGMIPHLRDHPYPDLKNPNPYFNRAPSMEKSQAMGRWIAHFSPDVSDTARNAVIGYLPRLQERDDRWVTLASTACGLAADDIQSNVAMGGDNMLLATLICISSSRKTIDSVDYGIRILLETLTHIDICHTLPGLQHDFCTLWNELIQDGRTPRYRPHRRRRRRRNHGSREILERIRCLYITLHPDAEAAFDICRINEFEESAPLHPNLYPLCDIASHRPESTPQVPAPISRLEAVSLLTQSTDLPNTSPHHSTFGGNTVSQQVNANIIQGLSSPSDPTASSEIGNSSQIPAATEPALPVHTSPRPTDASPPVVIAAALPDIPRAATSFRPLEGTTLQDIVGPCAEPDSSEILSTATTFCDADAASASDPLLPAFPLVGFSVPASSPPSRVPPMPNTELLALLDGTTPSRSIGNATFPGLRGLVNSGSMCFANAVFQLLVHSPPLWNLFSQLGDLRGQGGTGAPAAGGGATPLVDATVRSFKEFMNKEKRPPPTQQPLRQAAGGKPKEDEEAKNAPNSVDLFELTYIFDVMKEKTKLKRLLNGQQQDAEEFFRLYLDALDEELLALLGSISSRNAATPAPGVEEPEESQSDSTEVVERGLSRSVELPLMRIFGGKFRSTLRAPNQPDTVTAEAWLSLQLDIQHDSVHAIEDALARITHPQPVQLGPSGLSEASQQVFVEVLPPILVLHLKRFLYDSVDGIVKVSKHVRFAPELEISLEIMAPVTAKSVEPVHYKLYGVLYHHGESASCGHYTVDVLRRNENNGGGEGWLYIDDEVVSTLQHEDVFGGDDNELVDGRCAYMLFYCRTAAAGTR